MKKAWAILSVSLILSASCTHEVAEDGYVKAEVMGEKDISCASPLLSFEDDSIKIRKLTKNESLLYTVIALPDSLRITGKKLYVEVRTLTPDEEFVCNTLGINYPHLKVIAAKERE